MKLFASSLCLFGPRCSCFLDSLVPLLPAFWIPASLDILTQQKSMCNLHSLNIEAKSSIIPYHAYPGHCQFCHSIGDNGILPKVHVISFAVQTSNIKIVYVKIKIPLIKVIVMRLIYLSVKADLWWADNVLVWHVVLRPWMTLGSLWHHLGTLWQSFWWSILMYLGFYAKSLVSQRCAKHGIHNSYNDISGLNHYSRVGRPPILEPEKTRL